MNALGQFGEVVVHGANDNSEVMFVLLMQLFKMPAIVRQYSSPLRDGIVEHQIIGYLFARPTALRASQYVMAQGLKMV